MNAILKLTDTGKGMLIAALSGDALTFTKIKIGSGAAVESPNALIDLVHTEMEVSIAEAEKGKDYMRLEAVFDNSKLSAGFEWTETGVFARDNSGNEKLYAYYNANGESEYIPVNTSGRTMAISLSVLVSIGDAANVNVVLAEGSIFATREALNEAKEEFNAHKNNTENPHKVTAKQLNLDKVNNTADTEKPVSTPQKTYISNYHEQMTIAEIANILGYAVITKQSDGRNDVSQIAPGKMRVVIADEAREVIYDNGNDNVWTENTNPKKRIYNNTGHSITVYLTNKTYEQGMEKQAYVNYKLSNGYYLEYTCGSSTYPPFPIYDKSGDEIRFDFMTELKEWIAERDYTTQTVSVNFSKTESGYEARPEWNCTKGRQILVLNFINVSSNDESGAHCSLYLPKEVEDCDEIILAVDGHGGGGAMQVSMPMYVNESLIGGSAFQYEYISDVWERIVPIKLSDSHTMYHMEDL